MVRRNKAKAVEMEEVEEMEEAKEIALSSTLTMIKQSTLWSKLYFKHGLPPGFITRHYNNVTVLCLMKGQTHKQM